MVTSCKIIVQFHNQDIDINPAKIENIPLPRESLMLHFNSHMLLSCPHPVLKPWQPQICSSFLKFHQFKNVMSMELCSTQLFRIGFFHSKEFSGNSSTLLHVSVTYPFLLLSSIPWWGRNTGFSFILWRISGCFQLWGYSKWAATNLLPVFV